MNRVGFLLVLGSAVGVPILLSKTGAMKSFAPLWSKVSGQATEQAAPISTLEPVSSSNKDKNKAPIEGLPVTDLGEILRWDVSVPWILGRWSRVSTALADLDLQGYRVALVTGTRQSDLAGALTYYFDKSQKAQRITFSGTTGDGRQLVALLSGRHGFIRELTDDPRMYLYRSREDDEIIGEMRIKPATVVRMENAHARFEIALTMRRPQATPTR